MMLISAVRFIDTPSGDGTLLRIEWVPATVSNYGIGCQWPGMQGLQVSVYPLAKAEGVTARTTHRQATLAELDTWARSTLQAPETRLLTRRHRGRRRVDSRLTHYDG